MTVRDEIPEISRGLRRLVANGCNLVFTTGGLGPTHDDKTLLGVANAFELSMELNDEALKIVTRQYTDLHKRGVIDNSEITEPRRKMAVLPRNAKPLDNRVGGAPGVLLDVDGAQIISLPGVPGEFMWIFDNQLLSLLKGDHLPPPQGRVDPRPHHRRRDEGRPRSLHQIHGEALRGIRHQAVDLGRGTVPVRGRGEGEPGGKSFDQEMRGAAAQRLTSML